jgi:predicted RNase H-like HicB family nuclease
MKQRYHTIIKPDQNGCYVGWVEEIPGALTHGRTLGECRERLRAALELMIETHRDEARIGLDPSCIQDTIEVEIPEPEAHLASAQGAGVTSQYA